MSKEQVLKVARYTDELLQIIEIRDEVDHSDLEGMLQAFVMKILNDN